METLPNPATLLESVLRECKHALRFLVLFSLGANLLMLALPLYSLQVLDRVLTSGSTDTLLLLVLLTVGLISALALLQEARTLFMLRSAQWIEARLSGELLSLSITSAATRGNAGGAQNLRDMAEVKNFLTGAGISALLDAPWAPLYLGVIFIIHPLLGFIALLGALLLLGCAALNEIAVRRMMEKANDQNVRAMQRVESSLRNAHTIVAMGMIPAMIRLWKHDHSGAVTLQSLASHRSGLISSLSRYLRMLLQVILMAVGAWLTLANELSMGGIIASSLLIGRALAPFETAISTWKGVVDTRKSLHRLRQNAAHTPPRQEEIGMPIPKGRILAENLIYVYPGATKPTLRGISFALEPGQALGIIGESASGKSTLAKLLMGVWKPQAGFVRLDGADVYSWKRDDFGKHVGYLPQEMELFEGTIRDNICRFQEDVRDEEVVEAARIAGVHAMILSLPQGYRTLVGTGGSGLSAGQRQRVALARAFFGAPKMVVLDEPNSNLDAEGEKALVDAIRHAKQTAMTCIVISHRPTIVHFVDTLLILRDGQVADIGPSAALASKYLRSAPPAPKAAPAAASQPTGITVRPSGEST